MISRARVWIDAGVTIQDACTAAVRVARHLRAPVEFNFNGVECIASPDTSAEKLAEAWRSVMNERERIGSIAATA